jgi:hypothetical protein
MTRQVLANSTTSAIFRKCDYQLVAFYAGMPGKYDGLWVPGSGIGLVCFHPNWHGNLLPVGGRHRIMQLPQVILILLDLIDCLTRTHPGFL